MVKGPSTPKIRNPKIRAPKIRYVPLREFKPPKNPTVNIPKNTCYMRRGFVTQKGRVVNQALICRKK